MVVDVLQLIADTLKRLQFLVEILMMLSLA